MGNIYFISHREPFPSFVMAAPIVCHDSCFTGGPFLTAEPSRSSSPCVRVSARSSSSRGMSLLRMSSRAVTPPPRISSSSHNDPSCEKTERDEDATIVDGPGFIESSTPSEDPPSISSQQKRPHQTPRPQPRGLPLFLQDLAGNMAPRENGDMRDIILMSLSFAVYVYISQKLVCAYCIWQSMGRHF